MKIAAFPSAASHSNLTIDAFPDAPPNMRLEFDAFLGKGRITKLFVTPSRE
jgi:hypothetical protein